MKSITMRRNAVIAAVLTTLLGGSSIATEQARGTNDALGESRREGIQLKERIVYLSVDGMC